MWKKSNHRKMDLSRAALFSAALIFAAGLAGNPSVWAESPEDGAAGRVLSIAAVQKEIQRGRETRDAQDFDRAEGMLDRLPQQGKDAAKVLGLRAWIALFQHRFQGAVVLATAARNLEPTVAFYEGLLSDAYLELGHYEKSLESAQRMLDLRPDQAAFSRAAHLRSLHGNPEGAIALWQRAIQGGGGSPENTAWCQVELGDEYFNLGKLKEAEQAYQAALKTHPSYHRAFFALGRLAAARDRNVEALGHYRKALAVVPSMEYAAALGEAYLALGNKIEAEKQFALVEGIAELNRLHNGQDDRALALFYADHNRKLDTARRISENEAALRKDIFTQDVLAWVEYKAGRYTEAESAIQQALRTGTRLALFHFHAGMIAQALGKEKSAAERLAFALKQNPHFHPRQAHVARQTLVSLRPKKGVRS